MVLLGAIDLPVLAEKRVRAKNLKKASTGITKPEAAAGMERSRSEALAKFSFKTAAWTGTDSTHGTATRPIKIQGAEMNALGGGRRPLRLRFQTPDGKSDWTIEMSERDAFAFSEWLDEVVTEIEVRKG